MAPSQLQRLNPFRRGRKETAANPSTIEKPLEACPQGLTVVAEGQNAVVDIFAVHGLNGHRDETWTAANGRHWLRDLLPNDLPHARIFCWGYDANTYGDRVSCQYLYDHAKTLVSDLCLKRKLTETTMRPIIFVAHSLGGIIVKSALIHSDAARKGALEEHRSIKTSTYGIIFMGTPHQGGSGVQLGKLLVNVASIFVAADDRLMKHLERDSEWLQQQLGQYGPISGDFVTKFAYEEYKTPTKLGPLIMVVPRASAVVPGAADAEPIAIHADHTHMVKFESEGNSGYKTVSGHLRVMAQSASETIHSRWEEETRVNVARVNHKESFSISFSLAEVSETEHFVARQKELADIQKALGDNGGRCTVVLQGLGGIGKTQLAVAYAKLHRADYTAVLWVNIKDEDALKQSFARIARQILRAHPSASRLSNMDTNEKLDEVVDAVKAWLSLPGNTRWLMIYDNYDNPKIPGYLDLTAVDIRKFFPESHQGFIIITTRSPQVRIGHAIQVRKLRDTDDSLQILSHTSRREGLSSDPDAIKLAQELDGLPLALATAGAYLDQVAISVSDYLRLYKESWVQLQAFSPGLSSYEDRTLYSTWQISFDHVKQQNQLSAKLLCFWAYFDNQDLWLELLQHSNSGDPNWVGEVAKDELTFYNAMRVLSNHGLVEVETSAQDMVESRGYSIHGCVHAWTVSVLNQTWNYALARLAVKFVATHVPTQDAAQPWPTQRRLLQHANRCSYMVLNSLVRNDNIAWECHFLGNLYADQGKLVEAERMYQRALQGYEKAWGPEHTSTLDT
ncbi:Protein SERAC1, partial [Lachnellula arida]